MNQATFKRSSSSSEIKSTVRGTSTVWWDYCRDVQLWQIQYFFRGHRTQHLWWENLLILFSFFFFFSKQNIALYISGGFFREKISVSGTFFPLIAQEKMQPKGHRASREGIVATHFKLKRVDGVGGAALQSTQWENT